jgi:hypothetical protein
MRYRYGQADMSCLIEAVKDAEMLIQSMDERMFLYKEEASHSCD